MKKILIIEDDKIVAKELQNLLNNSNYESMILDDFENAKEVILKSKSDLILLDINIPYINGELLLKSIRKESNIPVIMVTSRTSETDEVLSMSYGADDYIKKPYTLNVLLAKVKATLDRYEKARDVARKAMENSVNTSKENKNDARIMIREDLYLDTATHKLINHNEAEELRAMEYKLLLYLLENPGRVITRDELFDNVWEDENTCDGTITVHIRHIREKIEADPKNPEIIKTVYGVGYMVEEVNG